MTLIWPFLATAIVLAGTSIPLSEQEIAQLIEHVSPGGGGETTAKGYRFSNGNSRAELYGPVHETASGTCHSTWLSLYGTISNDSIQWQDTSKTQVYTRAWLKSDRNGRSCADMTSQPNILLRSPVEEQTLIRISAVSQELYAEAIKFLPDNSSIKETEVADLLTVEIQDFRIERPAYYDLQFWISESTCRGISVEVVSDDNGGFYVTGAWEIQC